ncbi:hypothetical protein A2767_06245 [Candidatus Roizmanbacteria bacterium RIFCSPHIGHO2_01_FULL_35_10]|uniref:Uncharacterized protein n=1 Tax=Candidatus Roizmanbacteria bacterium RIFCSPLOWO2_01_FULL_35_13 TaxID=1802055 RepID=A0A1F7I6L8_9BACT|nr:MAG: hypothetical protein A2767_06245 [Candidatus Roizmanbacteria bacterium RIFCSPHIGHO2_01_FULL_35_10]OGK39009.1 MAG: hypothetical protein A3A74_06780 [Candidatus Roizmanbacteria bacterium RIFCSPLOWO2_01_FULL_35_13]
MNTQTIQEQIDELKSKQQLNRRERRYLMKLEEKLHPEKKSNTFNWKNLTIKASALLLVVVLIGVVIWYKQSQPAQSKLPPIDITGHIEQNPPSHISDQEMPESIQKHMLEHADGKGKPGVVIQYNCKKYICEKGLTDKLKQFVKKYSENVYLAPGNYDGKIILTRLGKRDILESYDEKKIKDFITF